MFAANPVPRASEQAAAPCVWSDALDAGRRSAALKSQLAHSLPDLDWLTRGDRAFGPVAMDVTPASGRAFLAALEAACAAGSPWLLHPAAGPLAGRDGDNGRVWLQFLHWAGRHGVTIDGRVTVDEDVRLWSPDGVQAVSAGTYDLARLSRPSAGPDEDRMEIDVDVSWDSLGGGSEAADLPEAWRSPPIDDLGDVEQGRLLADLRALFNAQRLLARGHPEILAWILSTTFLCLPIHRTTDTRFKSASRRDMPGAVFFDLNAGWRHLLEALVHETAHAQLFVDEWAGPLIEPGHTRTYASPLRPEPRPLRGILLAYHALAYMAALYHALEEAGEASEADDGALIRRKLEASRETLLNAREGLTAAGRDLVRRTETVCDHALS